MNVLRSRLAVCAALLAAAVRAQALPGDAVIRAVFPDANSWALHAGLPPVAEPRAVPADDDEAREKRGAALCELIAATGRAGGAREEAIIAVPAKTWASLSGAGAACVLRQAESITTYQFVPPEAFASMNESDASSILEYWGGVKALRIGSDAEIAVVRRWFAAAPEATAAAAGPGVLRHVSPLGFDGAFGSIPDKVFARFASADIGTILSRVQSIETYQPVPSAVWRKLEAKDLKVVLEAWGGGSAGEIGGRAQSVIMKLWLAANEK